MCPPFLGYRKPHKAQAKQPGMCTELYTWPSLIWQLSLVTFRISASGRRNSAVMSTTSNTRARRHRNPTLRLDGAGDLLHIRLLEPQVRSPSGSTSLEMSNCDETFRLPLKLRLFGSSDADQKYGY